MISLKLNDSFIIRPIKHEDNSAVADIIRKVMPEFGASGPGFALHDEEVNDMYRSYSLKDTAYFVVVRDSRVLGGGGIAPLLGEEGLCELRKMYFLPELRGLGFGQKLIDHCLSTARTLGYQACYLETLENMKQANLLYQKSGFKKLKKPMGNTGHFSCDTYYLKEL
jgi:putative acetyltransferase